MKKTTLLLLFLISSYSLLAQCTEAKDSEMAKYKAKTLNQDAQGCSQCAMLALYFCSAKYCVKSEDVNHVGNLINACKQNIINMGQPYCCPEYINKEPQWGIMGASSGNVSANSSSNSNTNPMLTNTGNDATAELIANSAILVGNLLGSGSGSSSSDLNSLNSYVQGQQLADATTALVNMFTPSPEQKAKKERERLEAEKRAEEQRQFELKKRIENENNAKNDFQKTILDRYNINNENDRADIIIWGMDNYISDKYNYDVRDMAPNWKKWISESIQNNNEYVSTIFAGKTLGQNTNKFDYKVDLTTDQAINLLEKISNSETEYRPFLGINWEVEKKTIKITKEKKKVINKEINTFKVVSIYDGSAAFDSGLKKGDKILKINNNYIENIEQTIKQSKIGDKIDITFLRDGKEYTKKITLGSKIKDSFNVDAMIILANYYNTKSKGNNPEKALYYFTKAAENGSPNAMYSLGEIYQKNFFGDKKESVKYKFKKNEEFALEWYTKSILNTDYKTSTIHNLYKNGSYFEPKAFDELQNMYKKGIGCEKNLDKSNEILALKNSYQQKLKS